MHGFRRREFITLLGGTAAWPLAARAQQQAMKRIGILMNLASDDPESQSRLSTFVRALQERGWTTKRNLNIDYRWGANDSTHYRQYAAELVALGPDAILAFGAEVVRALQGATSTVPIVFAAANDPVGAGLVESLARPGGNTTGFTRIEYGVSAKWLELLKEVVPSVKRAAVIRPATSAAGTAQLAAIQSVAPSLSVELTPVGMRDAAEIERGISAFARGANGGLILVNAGQAVMYRELIIALAARYRLPAVYPDRLFVSSGGLISYGPDMITEYRLAAGYVDRILKGERPADLPVQNPTRYELILSLKTAKAQGITIPPDVFARADNVIE